LELQSNQQLPGPPPAPEAAPQTAQQPAAHSTAADTGAKFDLVIEAGKSGGQYLRDLWRYRELFYFLAWRDLLVRYKQTTIGVVWALLRPLLTLVVFAFIFGRVAGLPAPEGVPYVILVCAGMLPWQFFANALGDSANSLLANANLISKIYFPRMITPASAVVVSLVDFAISGVILAGLMAFYGCCPGWQVFLLPVFVLMAFAAATGAGLWLSALTVKYRDFRYITPFIVQFGLYVSPVGFNSDLIPERWRLLYSLNPMVGVIDGIRWSLLGTAMDPGGLIVSVAVVVALLASGVWYFRRTERSFADII
jgi:lipopolysaccharide transport system permease protein